MALRAASRRRSAAGLKGREPASPRTGGRRAGSRQSARGRGSAEKKTAPGDAQAPGAWRGWHRILHILQDCRPKTRPGLRRAHPDIRRTAPAPGRSMPPQPRLHSRGAPPLRAGCRRMRCRVGPGPQTRLCRAGHSAAPGLAHARQTSNSMDKATCRGYGKADPGAQRPAGRCRCV